MSEEARSKIKEGINKAFRVALKPPPKLNLVEWADTYRFLPSNSAESGKWRTHRVPPAREPMMSISNPDVQEITVMSCVQMLKTELMINTALFFIHQEPSPMMYVAPKKEIAEAWSKERFANSVKHTPVVADLFRDNRRGEGNTILQKQFAGGQISIVSARNPDDLAMRACRIMMFDECDKYESDTGGEGDPIAIAWGRATTYGKRAKKITACSPTIQGKSRIEQEYFKSNMCVYHQPCPHCGHAKELTWLDVIIPKDETGTFVHVLAKIVCSECGVEWSEGDRLTSIRTGFWVAQKPEITWHHGYKVTSLASPFTPVEQLAKEFVDAQNNTMLLKAFYNTRMAQTWKEIGDQPDWNRIYERREDYSEGSIPDGGLMVTAGMDIQKEGVFYEVVVWGRRRESWSIEKGYIEGSIEDQEMREKVYSLWDRVYKNSKGIEMIQEKICVDSGYNTQAVYALVRGYGSERVIAVKGEDNLKTPTGTPTPVDVNIDGQRVTRGLMLWKVGSSVIKEQVYSWLGSSKPTDEELTAGRLFPSGYMHFPQYDEEFFKQLTAEQYLRQEDNRGFVKYVWEKLRKDNHFLDCRVYARAASAILQIDRMSDADWRDRESMFYPVNYTVAQAVDSNVNRVNNRRKSNWIKRK